MEIRIGDETLNVDWCGQIAFKGDPSEISDLVRSVKDNELRSVPEDDTVILAGLDPGRMISLLKENKNMKACAFLDQFRFGGVRVTYIGYSKKGQCDFTKQRYLGICDGQSDFPFSAEVDILQEKEKKYSSVLSSSGSRTSISYMFPFTDEWYDSNNSAKDDDYLQVQDDEKNIPKNEKPEIMLSPENVLIKYNGPGGDVVIPEGVTGIGEDAFAHSDNITSIVIPESVTCIGRWAFAYCASLKKIVIPESVTCIGRWAFAYCASLKKIVIPESVTCIEEMAFYKCLSLTEIVIPEGVKKIGNSAFEDCIRLKKVYFEGAIPKCGANIFAGCRELTLNAEIFFTSHKLNVSLVSAFPKENSKAVAYIHLYQNGKKWNDFADSVAKDHAEEIAEEIFTLLQNSKKVEGDVGMKAAMFIVRWRDNIKLEQIKKIYSLLQKNNCTEAIKTLDADDEKAQEAENISKQESIQEVSLEDSKNEGTFSDKSLAGLTFVVTGNVNTFSSRSELKKFIEERGGKLTGSVSSQTNYLITNTPNSGTSKNRAAQDLGVEIITEEQFRKMVKG